MSIVHVNQENFQKVVMEAQNRVLIDFWATWCGPCQMIAPHVEELAREREDITVCKVDVDEAPELAAKFGITSIPTLVVMDKGQVVQTALGFRPKAAIEKLLD